MAVNRGSVTPLRLPLLLLLCITSCLLHSATPAPAHQFSFGRVEGNDVISPTSSLPVYVYYGIPFAEPPVGQLRFEPPVPYRGRGQNNVISSSTGFRDSCMQYPPKPSMSEDCLHLTVYTPGSPVTTQSRKVMVYIHGGGYVEGDSQPWVPTDLVADHDVIVVMLHYRLGFLGFLSSGDDALPGNLGLRDQVMGLQWVKDNIRVFGGDPDDVTIFGQSAGAWSVSILSVSPYGKGLFNKAVMISGNLLTPPATVSRQRSVEKFYSLARRVDCLPWWYTFLPMGKVSTHRRVVECLRGKPAANITRDFPDVGDRFLAQAYEYIFAGPVIDGDFIPAHPRTLLTSLPYLQQHGVTDRSYMVGSTNEEANFLYGYFPGEYRQFAETDANMRVLAEDIATEMYPLGVNKEVVDFLDFTYSYPRQQSGAPALQSMVDIITDAWYGYPSVEFLSLLSATSPTTATYQYLFDHQPTLLDPQAPPLGTGHEFDLLFLFDEGHEQPYMAGTFDLRSQDSRTTTSIYRTVMSEFAKSGDPSRAVSRFTGAWPKFDLKDRKYMALTSQPEVRERVRGQRMSLWQDYLPKVTNKLFSRRRD